MTSTTTYTYSGTTVTATAATYDGLPNQTATFQLGANGLPASYSVNEDLIKYTFDSNNNLTSYAATGSLTQFESYTYDNKKNPFSMIGAPNFHFFYVATGIPMSTVNNIATDTPNITITYSYQYNSAGFLTSATRSSIYGNGTISYNYITK